MISDPTFPRLLADVGGTHARFAWRQDAGAALTDIDTLSVTDHDSLQAAAQHYLRSRRKPAPAAAAFGVATPVQGDMVRMTNHDWSFSILALQAAIGAGRLSVINDFTALALAVPTLQPADLRQIGSGDCQDGAPIALIGPGTGLGVAGLLCLPEADGVAASPRRWLPIPGEGGHVTLAASNDREDAVLRVLRGRYGHVSAERAVSGAGLVALFEAVCMLDDHPPPSAPWAPGDVTEAAVRGHSGRAADDVAGDAGDVVDAHDAYAGEALALFCDFLGTVAGDLALTLGAWGGVYIGGGILPKLADAFAASGFRARFEAKGRFGDYLAGIPTHLIIAESPALLGADRALDAPSR